jgi:hypothetical protein
MYDGYVDNITRYMVQGWALDSENPDQAVEILVLINGITVARITANMPRPDLAARKDLSSSHNGFSTYLPFRLDTATTQTVQIKFAATMEVVPHGTRMFGPLDDSKIAQRLAAVNSLALSPLLVTHIARSGSTLFMDILNRHPALLVAKHYPYEVKPATYYARAARLLTEPGDHEASASPTEFMRNDQHLGFNPFNHLAFDSVFSDYDLRTDFFERSSRETLFRALREVSNDYYRHLAADQNKTSATYFAEKCEAQGATRKSFLTLFPNAYEIILTRDPRDILCSSRAYFRPSGNKDFLVNVSNACERLLRFIREKRQRTVVVTYEALVCDQRAALSAVSDFLAIESGNWFEVSAPDTELFEAHSTATSPTESIGRWKRELSSSQKELCDNAFASFLDAFGYDA